MQKIFNSQHKSDKEKFNTSLYLWEVIKANEQGVHEGDCESYCRTLKHLDNQFKDWNYYYCKLNGAGHCVLMKNNSIIDCNCQTIILFDKYSEIYNVSDFKEYGRFTTVSKFILGKILSFMR